MADELAEFITHNLSWKGTRRIVLNGVGKKSGLDSEVRSFCRLIERLSPKALACWEACSAQRIDIGIDSGNVPSGGKIRPLELQISSSLLKKASSLGAELQITVYPYVVG